MDMKKRMADFLRPLLREALAHKTLVAPAFLALVMLVLLSAGAEYFVFGGSLRALDPVDRGISDVAESDIAMDGFIRNGNGILVSQTENAALIVHTGNRHVENLIVDFAAEPRYMISASIGDGTTADPESSETRDLSKNMTKGQYSFLRSFPFHIGGQPGFVTIRAKEIGTSFSGIRIDNTYTFNAYRFAFLLAIGIIVSSLVALRRTIGEHPERAFLIIILTCGTLFTFSEPRAFTSWDEHIHYKRADELSLKDIFPKTVKDIYANTNYVPYSFSASVQKQIDDHFDHDYKKPTKSNKSSGDDSNDIDLGSAFTFFTRISYLPSGLAIFAGRTLHVPRHVVFMFGQWVSLLVFSTTVFLAIRRLESGKMIAASVALLPTSVFLASNYSYDPWVTGFIILGLTYLFGALRHPDRKISTTESIIMIGTLLIGCAPKAIYFPILLLLFFVRRSQFDTEKGFRTFRIASAVGLFFVIASFVFPFFSDTSDFSDNRGGDGVDAMGQVRFILSDPIAYAGTLFNFLKIYLHPLSATGYTTFLAYLGSTKGFGIILAVIALVTVTDRNENDRKISTVVRLSIIGILLIIAGLISTAMYVSFTPVGSPIINGVQPRYLLPLLFPFLFVLGHPKSGIPTRFRNAYGIVVFGTLSVVLLWGLWDLVIRLHY
jgi:uncharacterized membrane protein